MGRVASVAVKAAQRAAVSATPLTDLGNAERFVRRHGASVRYVQGIGWHVWDGRRWALDVTRQVERLAHETVRSLTKEADDIRGAGTTEAWKELLRHAARSEDAGRIRAMLALAEPATEIHALAEDLDAQPELLNVENGTINLRTGELSRHEP